MIILRHLPLAILIVFVLSLTACAGAYYRTLESVGIEKRDILVDRVEDARESQEDAKAQFSSALEQYRALIDVEGGDLEKTYDRLNAAYERSENRAARVSERIDAVRSVAEDLFDEWERELGEYQDERLRAQSRELLLDTQRDYRELIAAMESAEARMQPVLGLFKDRVLFLRHNLNARAIGSLENELADIENATETLIREMERAIEEAGRFIESMR